MDWSELFKDRKQKIKDITEERDYKNKENPERLMDSPRFTKIKEMMERNKKRKEEKGK